MASLSSLRALSQSIRGLMVLLPLLLLVLLLALLMAITDGKAVVVGEVACFGAVVAVATDTSVAEASAGACVEFGVTGAGPESGAHGFEAGRGYRTTGSEASR